MIIVDLTKVAPFAFFVTKVKHINPTVLLIATSAVCLNINIGFPQINFPLKNFCSRFKVQDSSSRDTRDYEIEDSNRNHHDR